VQEKSAHLDPYDRERHFLPTAAEVEAVSSTIARVLGGDKTAARPTVNWTTYLDTSDLRYFLSFDGTVARRLRIREYENGAGAASSACYLELKQTSSSKRSKVRLAAPFPILARLIEGDPEVGDGWAVDDPRRAALRALREELAQGQVAARVGTWYRRRCLTTGPALRVTLDEELTFFHPGALGAPRPKQPEPLALGPAQVLEVKYAGELPSWLEHALRGLTEAPQFSKFRTGMLALRQAAQGAADGPILSSDSEGRVAAVA
jgi:hypothetical protein